MLYTVYWTNFGFSAPHTFATFNAARDYAKSKCQDATIMRGGNVAGAWGVIGGTRNYEVA